jgi:hypothetical protein
MYYGKNFFCGTFASRVKSSRVSNLLGPHQSCRDIPRIIAALEKARHKQLNSSLAGHNCYLQEKIRSALQTFEK